MTKTRRAKRGELRLTEVHIAKAELDAVPEAERIHFLMLAQTANELAMLRILTIQALNGAKGKRAVVETGLGIAFMLSRILADASTRRGTCYASCRLSRSWRPT